MIVLDNREHVIDACAELVDAILTTCAQVRVLATSREPLGVDGETVWRLEPLAADEARRLFLERARQRQPDFVPSAGVEAAIVALCERLDRLPLAIELAAARIGVMSPAEILAALDKRLDPLAHKSRAAPARHRSVGAAVEWSYDLLEPDEQRALRNLAVFVGGFDADAAIAVSPALTLEGFARLVDMAQDEKASHRSVGADGTISTASDITDTRDRNSKPVSSRLAAVTPLTGVAFEFVEPRCGPRNLTAIFSQPHRSGSPGFWAQGKSTG